MKLKSLLFGSAAVMAAGTGVQAADLPTVEPVEYVRICDVFGTGFFYIPGTDTCLQIGGYVRAESHYVGGDTDDLYGVPEFQVDNWTTRVRGHVNFDARTQTEMGLIRAYVALEGTRGPSTFTPLAGDSAYASGFGLASAFIQISNDWGTYTAGKFGSFFDFFGSKRYGTRLGLEDGTTDPNLFAWTFAGGNGFSFTLSAEDPKSVGRRRAGSGGRDAAGAIIPVGVANDDNIGYAGQEFPDGVANIRVDQGWGSAQIMGVVRDLHTPGDDGIGFAVGAGVSLGIPGGWNISAQGGYSEGAVAYISNDPGGLGDFSATGDDANEAWAVRGGISGPLFSPKITVFADGGYVHGEEDDGDDEYDFYSVAVGGKWTPVAGLSVGPEFEYSSLDMDDNAADDERASYDVWGVMWRIQRDF